MRCGDFVVRAYWLELVAGDHFEALHGCKLSTNLVGHSVRKVGVAGVPLFSNGKDDDARSTAASTGAAGRADICEGRRATTEHRGTQRTDQAERDDAYRPCRVPAIAGSRGRRVR